MATYSVNLLSNDEYAYSLEYEQSALAEQELEYIKAVAPGTKELSSEEAAAYLEKMGVSFSKQHELN